MIKTLKSLFRPRPEPTLLQIERPDLTHATNADIANEAVRVVMSGGAWTASDLAQYLIGPGWRDTHGTTVTNYIGSYLKLEHKRGNIARAEIHQAPGQARPSAVRYAVDWRTL